MKLFRLTTQSGTASIRAESRERAWAILLKKDEAERFLTFNLKITDLEEVPMTKEGIVTYFTTG